MRGYVGMPRWETRRKYLSEDLTERNNLGDTSTEGRIILKWILKKWAVRVWT
jgi:hypothetical protein